MRQFYTSVVERREPFRGAFATEPYETGWASEAIYFVSVGDPAEPDLALDLHVQISVDGVEWIDEGSVLPQLSPEGRGFVKVTHFGGWLRLRGRVPEDHEGVLTVQLALKE